MRAAAGDYPKSTGWAGPFTTSAGTRAPASATGERLTRSRLRLLAAEESGPKETAQSVGGKRLRVEGVGLVEEGTSVRRSKTQKAKHKTAAAGGTGRLLSAEEIALATRPLPPRGPLCPKSGKIEDLVAWTDALRNIQKLGGEDSIRNLPTLRREVEDIETVESVESLQDKDMVLDVARSVVTVSATEPDGTEILHSTGFIIGFSEVGKCAKILASSSIICTKGGKLRHPDQKVSVHLSNEHVVEARVLFFNDHYRISLLDIITELPLVPVSFGSRPCYGQDVFVLGRDVDCLLVVTHGSILSLEKPFLQRNHYMFTSPDSPLDCTGGPVINNHGEVIGMVAAHIPQAAIVSGTIVQKCIQMWNQFGRIAHPVHHLELKAVRMLNILRRDELSVCYNIRDGFVVNQVRAKSAAEKVGIRRGDVIDVIDLDRYSTVVELEEYLLGLGWDFMDKKLDPRSTVDLKIQVHDLREKRVVCTTLPMTFSDATVHRYS